MSVAFGPVMGLGPENLGLIAHGDGDFDVPRALKKGGGKIVVADEDTALIARLDDYAGLKRVAVPKEPEAVVDRFADMTMAELRDEANRLGVENPGRSKDEVLAAVLASVEEA